MQQLTLPIHKIPDAILSKNGYLAHRMPPRRESRFGALMIEAAKADGLYNPHKNRAMPTSSEKLSSNSDVALHMALSGGVTSIELSKATGIGRKGASNVLSKLRGQGHLEIAEGRTVNKMHTWVLTKRGKKRLGKG